MTSSHPSYSKQGLISDLFPPSWNLYSHKSSWSWSSTNPYTIGPQKDIALFEATSKGSYKPKLEFTPGSTNEPLAEISQNGVMTSQARASIPSAKYEGDLTREWNLFGTTAYRFSIPVPSQNSGPIGRVQTEIFEWRRSKGAEVRSIDKKGSGFKLVRCKDAPNAKDGKTQEDGKVVAVFVGNKSKKGKEMGKFYFLGSGLTGELGRTWAILAVASICYIIDAEVKAGAGAEVAGAVGEAAGAAGGC